MASASDSKSRSASTIGTDTETPQSQTPVVIDLIVCGQTKRNSLLLELDRLSNLVSGMTYVDSNKYLTALEFLETGKSDFKRLFETFIPMNPKHPLGLIAAARLEEWEGKLQAARKLINRGCLEYPKCEYMWLEACRLAANSDKAKAVIAEGVRSIPNSVKLWLQASNLENIDTNRIRVLKKGIRYIPDSVRLYKALAELSNEEDCKTRNLS